MVQVPLHYYFKLYHDFNLSLTLSWCPTEDFTLMGPILPFFSGTLGIMFWLQICKLLESRLGKNNFANIIGESTFSIMTHHLMGVMLAKYLLAALVFIFGISISDFDWEKIRSDVWYRPECPKIIFLIAGISFSIFVKSIERSVLSRFHT